MLARTLNRALALLAGTAVLYLCAFGVGVTVPPLGAAFNPLRGAWTAAADAALPHTETLRLPGLRRSVRVTFESNGVAHIVASDDLDAIQALGYLHARFRLFQMDLERRQGGGRLAQVFGPAAAEVDRFELQLGLLRTAGAELSQLDGRTSALLAAYCRGVNARIAEDRASGAWPLLFHLVGYTPDDWTPVDTLLVKGDMTQTLDYQTTPLTYALLVRAFGVQRTMRWFPVLPPNEQHPYDAGPYRHDAPVPIPGQVTVTAAAARTAQALLRMFAGLPRWAVAQGGASNNWAVDGTKSASGKAMLAGDPHLHLTLPSIWYQVTVDSPGYHFGGVSIPGTPGIVIGHNRDIAWSLTDTQSAVTYYYAERTDAAHPDQYFWKGAWRHFAHQDYRIPVKGATTQSLDVKLTVHGPVITQQGLTFSVWWAGALPSNDLRALSEVSRASDFAEFKAALRGWHAPTHNFVYADVRGNIGLIAPGYYPIVASGDPWLPLPGTGEADVVGTVPYEDVPQVYDPPQHFTFSANQRPVGATYPYYIGTGINDFDPGYRANEIARFLTTHDKVTQDDMAALQNDDRDFLAAQIVPRLDAALSGARLDSTAQQAAALLQLWKEDYRMDANSPAATIWWFFWNAYLQRTFGPWWRGRHVGVSITDVRDGLSQQLEHLTLSDPNSETFVGPGVDNPVSNASTVMVAAFKDAVRQLSARFGDDPLRWTWGRYHQRRLQSLALIPSLGYGPRPAGGDAYTPDAAGGDDVNGTLVSDHGPSWRMLVDWGGADRAVYPGGQSENPVSAWYSNRAGLWWDGGYEPMLDGPPAASPGVSRPTWTLSP